MITVSFPNNRSVLWWLLLLGSIPSFLSLLRSGFFPIHDDLPVVRQFALEECLRDGQFPCRWTKELGFGYGYPLLNFYPPLPYLSGLVVRAVSLSLLDTTKVLFILGFILATAFMARLAAIFFDQWTAAAAALLYLYGPYHAVNLYVRGDLNELWAMAFFPLALWASYRLILKPNRVRVVLLAAALVGILLSHLGMSLIMMPVIALWTLLWLVVNRRQIKKTLRSLFLSGLFAAGLAAFFIVPVLVEQSWVHAETLTIGYFNFLAHFVDIHQLFLTRFWGYGASVWGPNDGMSFQIGILHWLLAAIGIFGLRRWLMSARRTFLVFGFFAVVSLGAALMMHWKATPIWLAIPKLDFLQFPWRFLALVLPAVSLLAAAAFSLLPRRWKPISLIWLVFLLLILYGAYFRPESWFSDRTDLGQFSGKVWQREITAGIFDYLPKWSKMPPGSAAPSEVVVKDPVTATTLNKKSNLQEYAVDNPTLDSYPLIVNTFYYPGWEGELDGRTTAVKVTTGNLGLMQIAIPPGIHRLSLHFDETPLRLVADILSLISGGILLLFLLGRTPFFVKTSPRTV